MHWPQKTVLKRVNKTNKEEILTLIENYFFFERFFSYDEISKTIDTDASYEGNQVAKFFECKANKGLTIENLLDHYPFDHTACLSFMKPEAASYFIGGFMYMSLFNIQYGQDLRFHLISKLEKGDSYRQQQLQKWFKDFLSYLSVQQKATIIKYIDYIEKTIQKICQSLTLKKLRIILNE